MDTLPPPNPEEGLFSSAARIKAKLRGGAEAGRGDIPHKQVGVYPYNGAQRPSVMPNQEREEPREFTSKKKSIDGVKKPGSIPLNPTKRPSVMPNQEREPNEYKKTEDYQGQEVKTVKAPRNKKTSKYPEKVNKYQKERDWTPPYGIERPKL